ncbi:MAG: hypothetical protein ACR2LR_15975 [Hassallia sp.]
MSPVAQALQPHPAIYLQRWGGKSEDYSFEDVGINVHLGKVFKYNY